MDIAKEIAGAEAMVKQITMVNRNTKFSTIITILKNIRSLVSDGSVRQQVNLVIDTIEQFVSKLDTLHKSKLKPVAQSGNYNEDLLRDFKPQLLADLKMIYRSHVAAKARRVS